MAFSDHRRPHAGAIPVRSTSTMTLQQLRDFLAIAEHGSLRQAARALGVSQAGLTTSLQALEASLGTRLLERSVRGASLTDAGRALLPRARLIDREADRARDEAAATSGQVVGHLHVGLGPTPTAVLLHLVVPDFHARFPAVRLHLTSGLFPDLKPALQQGAIELAVTAIPDEGVGPGLNSQMLFRSDLVVVGRRGHACERSRSVRELVDREWVLLGQPGSPGGTVTRYFAEHGLPAPRVAATCESLTHLSALLVGTDWLALVPVVLMRRQLLAPDVVTLPLAERPPRYANCIVTRSDRAWTPAAQAFAAMCQSCARVLKGREVGLH
jgi:LysR family transcriptional regulator, regulator of abg operon